MSESESDCVCYVCDLHEGDEALLREKVAKLEAKVSELTVKVAAERERCAKAVEALIGSDEDARRDLGRWSDLTKAAEAIRRGE